MNPLENDIENIKALCDRHNVAQLFVFGSILTESFNESSDIDFLVGFQGIDLVDYANNYFNLKESLENLLNRQVDLLEDSAIKNPYLRQSIDSSKKLIYG
jgi:hypothetical protein